MFHQISASACIPQIHFSRAVCLQHINFLFIYVKLTPLLSSWLIGGLGPPIEFQLPVVVDYSITWAELGFCENSFLR